MNVAALDLTADPARTPAGRIQRPESVGHATEWIDPEGSDWFAEIYREVALGAESGASGLRLPPDLEHWFG
jgi:hypothetical protein